MTTAALPFHLLATSIGPSLPCEVLCSGCLPAVAAVPAQSGLGDCVFCLGLFAFLWHERAPNQKNALLLDTQQLFALSGRALLGGNGTVLLLLKLIRFRLTHRTARNPP